MRLLPLLVLALLAAGCAQPPPAPCGLSVKPHPLRADERAIPLDEGFLAEHPTLARLLREDEITPATGSTLPCEEGARTLAALREQGGPERTFRDHPNEALVAHANATYFVGFHPREG